MGKVRETYGYQCPWCGDVVSSGTGQVVHRCGEPELPYGGEPPAQSHSATSISAAESIAHKIGPMHRMIIDWLKAHPKGATDEMLGDSLYIWGNTLRPRRRELQLMGYIIDSGRVAPTRSGRNAVIWTLGGENALANPEIRNR